MLRHYNVGNLLQAIGPRTVVLVNPSDASSATARGEMVNKGLAAVFESVPGGTAATPNG